MMNTVAAAAAMKVAVATRERIENRARPQMPCPLVQPEPKVVPTPTMNPAMMVVGIVAGKLRLLQSFRPTKVTRSAPSGRPTINAIRHCVLDGSLVVKAWDDANASDASYGEHHQDRRE
jgi:hypothetical protein